ncbi:MAG TPA: ATP-binding cassette domain-containing protein [Actinomycetes bacterium]|nr:ATP-binding cassette domain-containing protein [Actinomycetes bacterium]
MTPVPALEVDGVAFAYPDGHQALYGVSLSIQRRERVALLGPNGAGKTTLVLQLNGVLLPGVGRVAVATVLAMEPEILILDEPSSNLDPASRRELAEIVTGLDITILMVTHDLPYALQLCPRSLIMNRGTITADGPTAELLADAELLAANRLELPYGFDPAYLRRR